VVKATSSKTVSVPDREARNLKIARSLTQTVKPEGASRKVP
jgi:hypothetical protein